MSDDLVLRRASLDDLPTILRVAGTALGWDPDAPNEAFFRWKHRDNPFGVSPMWLAETPDGEAAGFRTFMRWRWRRADGTTIDAVRAVDTATLPGFQGRGIFKRLTLHAVDAMIDEGVGFVFNTPNDQSRPGYLKMGWEEVGKVPLGLRPTSVRGLARAARSRVPAEKWSRPTSAGDDATAVLADDAVGALLDERTPQPPALTTDRSVEFLRWRYGLPQLHYRAVTAGRVEDGVALFRLRRRGGAVEATICEVLTHPGDRRTERELVAAVVRAAPEADYLVRGGRGEGFVTVSRQGPVLTWRALTETTRPHLRGWDLTLGDVELF